MYKRVKNHEPNDNSYAKQNDKIKNESTCKEKYKIELRNRIELNTRTYLGLKFITNKYSIRNSNILTILTKTEIFTFALLSSNSFTHWYHTITDNMGPEFQFEGFLIENTTSLTSNKLTPQTESVILHIREENISLTSNDKSPFKVLKVWNTENVRQFRAIDNKFILETINTETNSKHFYVIISNYSNEMNFRLNYVLREKARKKANKSFARPVNEVINQMLYSRKLNDQRESNEDDWDYENPFDYKLRFHSRSSNYENNKKIKDDIFNNNAESYLSLNNQNLLKSKSSFQASNPLSNSSLSLSNNQEVVSDYIDYIPDIVLHHHLQKQQNEQQSNLKLANNSSNDNYQKLKLSFRSESLNSALSRLENEQHELTDDYYDYQIPYSQRNGIKEIKFSPIVTISSENVLDENNSDYDFKPKAYNSSVKRNTRRVNGEDRMLLLSCKSDMNMDRKDDLSSANSSHHIKLRNKNVNKSNSRIIHFLNNIPLSAISINDNENKSRQSLVNEFSNIESNDNIETKYYMQKDDRAHCKVCKRNLDGENQFSYNLNSSIRTITDENVGSNEIKL